MFVESVFETDNVKLSVTRLSCLSTKLACKCNLLLNLLSLCVGIDTRNSVTPISQHIMKTVHTTMP